MIGTGLKKLANENNMRIDAGIAYGSLRGYATTMCEGAGWKELCISTSFTGSGNMEALLAETQTVNVQKLYRVRNLTVAPAGVIVTFHDDIGTMKKILAFIDWFYPLLAQYGATGVEICRECGSAIAQEQWYLINGVAHNFHESCAHKVIEEIHQENQQRREAETGSYLTGAVGALLGALLGAVAWSLVLYLGYIASLVGLLIGWLANKGYDLLKGKQGKGKVWILIAAVVVGVLIGNFGSDVITLCKMIAGGQWPGATYMQIPLIIYYTLLDNSEYARAVISDGLIGLLFAGLGVFGILRKTGRETADQKVKKLK